MRKVLLTLLLTGSACDHISHKTTEVAELKISPVQVSEPMNDPGKRLLPLLQQDEKREQLEMNRLAHYLSMKLNEDELSIVLDSLSTRFTYNEREQLKESWRKWRSKYEELDGGRPIEVIRTLRFKK
jgi:hypothetical protein